MTRWLERRRGPRPRWTLRPYGAPRAGPAPRSCPASPGDPRCMGSSRGHSLQGDRPAPGDHRGVSGPAPFRRHRIEDDIMDAVLDVAPWIGAPAAERGDVLRDLLLLADRLPSRRSPQLTFPRLLPLDMTELSLPDKVVALDHGARRAPASIMPSAARWRWPTTRSRAATIDIDVNLFGLRLTRYGNVVERVAATRSRRPERAPGPRS